MAKTKSGRQRRKQRELREAFQLKGVIKREPNGRASRAKRVRRVEPSPQVIKAKKSLWGHSGRRSQLPVRRYAILP